jgi:UDP-glucose 4-epimerase
MNILFTGASSFSGYWMVHALSAAGHRVVAPLRGTAEGYLGIKARRVAMLPGMCEVQFGIRFGDLNFLNLIETQGPFDILCHHAAEVGNYKSPDFDALAALSTNVNGLVTVLRKLAEKNCRRMIVTGSVFEQEEGVGPEPKRAFSPYGLSKGLTAQYVRYYAEREGVSLGKFVIPNPFGPLEEPRFISYLMRMWLSRQVASVKTPDYLRDNIHVDLLALAYAKMVQTLPDEPGYLHYGPSGYIESMGDFTHRVAHEMTGRLHVPCLVKLEEQTDFSEPLSRVNSDRPDGGEFAWSESEAWDKLANFYLGK